MNYTLSVQGMRPISGSLNAPTVPVDSALVVRNQLAIVSKLETYMADPRPIEVNAVAWQDADIPTRPNKGHTIPVTNGWRRYLQKIQTAQAYKWLVEPYTLWINRTDWMCECIGAGYGNFVEILGKSLDGQYYEIRASAHNANLDTTDPAVFNWKNFPQLFGKCTARRKDGTILNVGARFDVYMPIIKQTPKLWVYAAEVELFPAYPAGVTGYVLDGASIYGYTGANGPLLPLRLARKPGELVEPYTGWHLKTGSVIPPA